MAQIHRPKSVACHMPPSPPSALEPVLESANPRIDSECASGCPWSTARGNSPVSGTADPRSSQTGQVIRGLR